MNNFILLALGLLSGLFFSSTFLINKIIAFSGGHWFYTAFLRYFWTLLFIAFLLIIFKGFSFFKSLIYEFVSNLKFYLLAGSIGFGVFYSFISFAASFSDAWIIVTTWQLTIFASIFILIFYKKRPTFRVMFFAFLIVLGVSLVNFSYFDFTQKSTFLYSFLSVLIAAFAYPIGNQMLWEEQKKRHSVVLENALCKVFLITIGSTPVWILLFFIFDVGLPSLSQTLNVALVSLLASVIATTIFLYARSKAANNTQIMIVDSTIASEVIFTLFIEILFLNGIFPSAFGFLGLIIVITSLIFISYA